ncbi:MAG TPA: patatin-like phospholipase family protein [Terriglobales bacterium]|nr:patatin-like phospholipase family protein [Terriglobales bacterium]
MGTLARWTRSFRAFKKEFSRSNSPSFPITPFRKAKFGIALGGGFARGLAHIGVLKVLEEEKVPIDFVAGTSVGSIIGAAYCSGMSTRELEEVARLVRFKDFARWTISRYGFASNDRMAGFLKKLLKCRTFEELRIPLAVAATDFVTGEGMVFRSGGLVDPVRASCAYPGMFLPVHFDGRQFVDGMLSYPVPAQPLRKMGADRVISVHLSANWVNLQGPRHIFDVIGQCFSIAQESMCDAWHAQTDVKIEPDVRGFSYDSFDRAAELIAAGETAARVMLPAIRKLLEPAVRELEKSVVGTNSPVTSSPAPAR